MAAICAVQVVSLKFASLPGKEEAGSEVQGQRKEKFHFDVANRLEWMTYDWRVKYASRCSATTRLCATNLGYVECRDLSVAALVEGQLGEDLRFGLLWPRHLYGRAIRELKAERAKAVGLDILLGELRPDHQPVKLDDGKELGSDEFFAQQSRDAGNVLVAATPEIIPPELFRTNAYAAAEVVAESDADTVLRRTRAYRDYRYWCPVITRWARIGDIDLDRSGIEEKQLILARSSLSTNRAPIKIPLDADGRVGLVQFYKALQEPIETTAPRKAKPFVDARVWEMGVRLAAIELGLDLEHPEIDLERGRIKLHGPNGDRVIPVDRSGFFYIDWSLRRDDPRLTKLPFEMILARDIARRAGETNDLTEMWQDKLVVVGSTASGSNLTDRGATPLEKDTPLMTKYWNVANAVILNRFIHRAAAWEELLLVLVMGTASALITWKMRALWASFWVAVLVVAYCVVAMWLFVEFRYWLPMVLPVGGALLMTHVSMVTYRAIFEQKERQRVKSIFSKIVAPDVVNELLGQEKVEALAGTRRELTVLFADVRGFTQLTDENQKKAEEYVRKHGLTGAEATAYHEQSARETLATVNIYLATIADNVKKHNGTLDKYIGDCVMAFWGAPVPNERHAVACVKAAIDSQRGMYELNLQRAEENKRLEAENAARVAAGLEPHHLLALLTLGTGINTGTVTVGLMGSDATILNYTVFGREVNLASRLEGVSGRGRIIISEATHAALSRHDPELAASCNPLPATTVKGISQPIKIFEVPWKPPVLARVPDNTTATVVVQRAASVSPVAPG